MEKKKISIITPFYNEEDVVGIYCKEMGDIAEISDNFDFEFICVDDGSTDKTLERLIEFAGNDNRFRIVELSTNFGKEAALTAALDIATGDAVIPFDADLQDPPDIVKKLIDKWNEGYEVVLARRVDRSSDTILKRITAEWFYKINNALSRTKIPENVGDFRLMDRSVVDAVLKLPERQRFMKGLFAWVGFRTAEVDYARQRRVDGESKFSSWRLWNFALEGITSFSTAPLRVWTYVGLVGSLVAMLFALFIITRVILYGIDTPGYASLLVAVIFFGSLQLFSIGILGEYIGRIYIETKQRPLYVIRRIIGEEGNGSQGV